MKIIEHKLPDTLPIKCPYYDIIGKTNDSKIILQFEDGKLSSDMNAKEVLFKIFSHPDYPAKQRDIYLKSL